LFAYESYLQYTVYHVKDFQHIHYSVARLAGQQMKLCIIKCRAIDENVVSRFLQINVCYVVYSVYVHRVGGGVSRTEPLSLRVQYCGDRKDPFRSVATALPGLIGVWCQIN
jgi:hypothetical protein